MRDCYTAKEELSRGEQSQALSGRILHWLSRVEGQPRWASLRLGLWRHGPHGSLTRISEKVSVAWERGYFNPNVVGTREASFLTNLLTSEGEARVALSVPNICKSRESNTINGMHLFQDISLNYRD